MKLYLHVGTEKTGSSFLQTYLARNRDLLKKHGICYSNAGVQEANMQRGIITPGNASDLEKHITNEDWNKVTKWMGQKKKEAKHQNCTTLLLSNEILMTRFSKPGILSKYIEVLESLDIHCNSIMLMIREPVGQALSLYKHRSKEGVLHPIGDWLNQKFILTDAIMNFYKQLETTELSLYQYPYKKDSQYLVEVCINQWLNLDEEIKVEHTSVNPSLTLSELVLLCDIFKQDQILAKRYYDFMIKIDAKQKSDDNFYKAYIKNHINNFMVKYNKLWEDVNKRMSVETETWKYTSVETTEDHKISSFSDQQMQQIANFIVYAKSFKYYRYKIIKKIRNAIVKITPKSLIEFRKKVLYS